MPANKIKIIIRRGLKALTHNKVSKKEKKRFVDIYKTVYRYATKKGQTHNQALDYCWNVYSGQAPKHEKSILKSVMSENMSTDRKQIRKMLLEMLEGEVINMADYQPGVSVVEPEPVMGPPTEYESFLSDIHTQMLDFMEENFTTLDADQQVFLDEMMDILEEEMGIEEEASFDFGEEEEIIADIEDDD